MKKTIREQAEKSVADMRASGFRHQTSDDERASMLLFTLERGEFERILNSKSADFAFYRYIYVLAPTPVRAYKNSLICLISNVCRIAVNFGLSEEYSYSLSDFYINELESRNDIKSLVALTKEILLHYYDLIHQVERNRFSPPVAKAIRYITQNLYTRFTVKQIAEHVGKEPHYFSVLFRQETGCSPSEYVMKEKLEEARKLLRISGRTISEVADALGFYDAAHLSRNFKRTYGESPSKYRQRRSIIRTRLFND